MTPQPSPPDRIERRDRALALRRRIKVLAATGGVTGVGLVGFLVAAKAPTNVPIPAVSAVSAVRTVTTVITVGEDGATTKTTTTTLSPGKATAGTAASAVTVTGGSTVVKKP